MTGKTHGDFNNGSINDAYLESQPILSHRIAEHKDDSIIMQVEDDSRLIIIKKGTPAYKLLKAMAGTLIKEYYAINNNDVKEQNIGSLKKVGLFVDKYFVRPLIAGGAVLAAYPYLDLTKKSNKQNNITGIEEDANIISTVGSNAAQFGYFGIKSYITDEEFYRFTLYNILYLHVCSVIVAATYFLMALRAEEGQKDAVLGWFATIFSTLFAALLARNSVRQWPSYAKNLWLTIKGNYLLKQELDYFMRNIRIGALEFKDGVIINFDNKNKVAEELLLEFFGAAKIQNVSKGKLRAEAISSIPVILITVVCSFISLLGYLLNNPMELFETFSKVKKSELPANLTFKNFWNKFVVKSNPHQTAAIALTAFGFLLALPILSMFADFSVSVSSVALAFVAYLLISGGSFRPTITGRIISNFFFGVMVSLIMAFSYPSASGSQALNEQVLGGELANNPWFWWPTQLSTGLESNGFSNVAMAVGVTIFIAKMLSGKQLRKEIATNNVMETMVSTFEKMPLDEKTELAEEMFKLSNQVEDINARLARPPQNNAAKDSKQEVETFARGETAKRNSIDVLPTIKHAQHHVIEGINNDSLLEGKRQSLQANGHSFEEILGDEDNKSDASRASKIEEIKNQKDAPQPAASKNIIKLPKGSNPFSHFGKMMQITDPKRFVQQEFRV